MGGWVRRTSRIGRTERGRVKPPPSPLEAKEKASSVVFLSYLEGGWVGGWLSILVYVEVGWLDA